jgi:hypothetical protein
MGMVVVVGPGMLVVVGAIPMVVVVPPTPPMVVVEPMPMFPRSSSSQPTEPNATSATIEARATIPLKFTIEFSLIKTT